MAEQLLHVAKLGTPFRVGDRRPPTLAHGLLTTLWLGDVLSALGLDHAASGLDVVVQEATARNDSPTALLGSLMRGA